MSLWFTSAEVDIEKRVNPVEEHRDVSEMGMRVMPGEAVRRGFCQRDNRNLQ